MVHRDAEERWRGVPARREGGSATASTGYCLQPSLQEWLETDGLGGFASSTTAGIHTRRYHGWLFLAKADPGDRWLALSKMDDTCRTGCGDWDLSSSFYPDVTHPLGVRNLWFFRKDPFPSFVYKLGSVFLTREIFMVKGLAGVFCRYSVSGVPGASGDATASGAGAPVHLTARPMCNSRPYHHITRAGPWDLPAVPGRGNVVLQGHPACGDLLLAFHGATFRPDPKWYYSMLYPRERERGLDYAEDHFSPGAFEVQIAPDAPGYFWAGPCPQGTTAEDFARQLPAYLEERRCTELARRDGVSRRGLNPGPGDQPAPATDELHCALASAADQFVVETRGGTSIIAGYHWFGEWGRDSFIALPGLLLATGRFDEARQVFARFAGAIRDGLVPNRFEEGAGAAYNSVDASLWMIRALRLYERAARDTGFALSMLPAVEGIVESLAAGTLYGIHAGVGGLLHAGSEGTQVTWMDASPGGVPVTPRQGYPVEVNALWVEALRCLARWARLAARPEAGKYTEAAASTAREFARAFSWPGAGLYDSVGKGGPVKQARANQVIAAGLAGLALPRDTLGDVWATATGRLLTPRGLRTLEPADPAYRGRYAGGPMERDTAYHQGTAWPWLLGSLYDLGVKLDRLAPDSTAGRGAYSRFVVERALPGVADLHRNPCVGSIFEVASGDWPYEPAGAVAQAWSVAEVLRVIKRAGTGHYLQSGRRLGRKRVAS